MVHTLDALNVAQHDGEPTALATTILTANGTLKAPVAALADARIQLMLQLAKVTLFAFGTSQCRNALEGLAPGQMNCLAPVILNVSGILRTVLAFKIFVPTTQRAKRHAKRTIIAFSSLGQTLVSSRAPFWEQNSSATTRVDDVSGRLMDIVRRHVANCTHIPKLNATMTTTACGIMKAINA